MNLKIENIPTPSAKRLEKQRSLKVRVRGGWDGDKLIKEIHIPEGETSLEFEIDGPLEHRNPDVLDGDFYHSFCIVYQNSTGSRREEASVSPVVQIEKSIQTCDSNLKSLKDEYERCQRKIEVEIRELRKMCSHEDKTYNPDPSGNNDSYYHCNVCGKESKKL